MSVARCNTLTQTRATVVYTCTPPVERGKRWRWWAVKRRVWAWIGGPRVAWRGGWSWIGGRSVAHAAAYTYLNGFPKKSENPPTTAAVATAAVQLPLRIPLCGVWPTGGSDSSGRSEEKVRRRIRGARAQVLHLRVCMIYIICICTFVYIYIWCVAWRRSRRPTATAATRQRRRLLILYLRYFRYYYCLHLHQCVL